MSDTGRVIRMSMRSGFDMLDFIQIVSDRLCGMAGLDEDAVHWVGVAIREGVINAIKHGNKQDPAKIVRVEFAFRPASHPDRLEISVCDEGEGFVPDEVADPLAPENVLKSSGRGIFFMRSFMDDVVLLQRPEGGMEVRLVKHLPVVPAAFNVRP